MNPFDGDVPVLDAPDAGRRRALRRRGVLLALTLSCAGATGAALAAAPGLLHPMFQDHAVLQRDVPLRIYGASDPGADVSVSLGAHRGQGRADASGYWEVQLPALPAGGPHTLLASSGAATQQVRDVLVGDVWLCSGQSNMVLQVHRSLDARAEIAGSANDRIRMLTVGETGSALPLSRFATPVQWRVASPQHAADFSATCFYFARELQKTVDVPMGLVVAAWGGSRIQAWTSAEALRRHGGYDTELDVLARYARDALSATADWGRHWQAWWRSRPGIAKDDAPWQRSRGDAGPWQAAPPALGAWERWNVAPLAEFNGMVWYRSSVTLSAGQARQDAVLALGPADEMDITWVNGRSVGSSYGAGEGREYPVPRGLLRAGENQLVINVLDTYREGGLSGPASRHQLRFADGSSVAFDGEWQYRIVPAEVGTPPRAPWHTAAGLSTLHNGMIAPIGRYGLRGFVWYQGESNTFEPERYGPLLQALLHDWRERFGAGLPLLNVQLAGYGPAPTRPGESGWAALREVQRRFAEGDDAYGLAVAIDIGDRYDIHPSNKQEVGRRLARAARHVAYGEHSLSPSGPVPLGARLEGERVVVRFGGVTDGLVAYGAEGPIGFEVCGAAAGSCRYASARIDGDRVLLQAPLDAPATRVRHAWADSPVVTLFDRAGLPAGPFELAIDAR